MVDLTPSNIVERAGWLGQTWLKVMTMGMSGQIANSTKDLAQFTNEIRAGGIDVWLWGWPQPDAIDEFVDHFVDVVGATNPSGYVLDMEKAWYSGCRPQAAELVARLRQATDLPLGLSSYGRPDMHKSFPWQELSSLDFGLPQIYDSTNKYGDGFAQRCIDDWQGHGFQRIVPTLGANSTSAERMKVIFDNTPLEDGACTWWSFGGLIQSESKCKAMRTFVVPKPR